MGSNLGHTMAAFALEKIEKQFNSSPLFYQNIFDIFAVFNTKANAVNFLQHINHFHPDLKFRAEHSIVNCINFLDLTIKCINGQINTAAIRALIYRAYKLSSSLIHFEKSYKIIQAIFILSLIHI